MIKHAIQSTMFSALSLVRSPPQVEELGSKLDSAGVPFTLDACRACADPCDLGHEEWPNRFDVDLSSDMLGSVKPYARQVVISTGKSDWAREVTEESNSLAEHLSHVHGKLVASSTARTSKSGDAPAGVFTASNSTRLSVLNGSHREVGCAPKTHTVLVFPDYKLVKDVPATNEGASELWKAALDPAVGVEGKVNSGMKSWTLPYSAVILLCSHKRRDNRCHIAAPVLEDGKSIFKRVKQLY
ncbi:sucrase/ferredoxin domain protein [Rhizoctonia solani AG-3 Rhs1AP]|uniref:Sucrase/ferredoxin domain protein n=1 Tax=Rhizoctonia solani AG-3 Rhs1AP TaxID=1086054 RepID=X8JUG3_9AGAM|nr:sucrase/ferredoxin domain protein [Rhizoctonia solani AG-3 Rhs1AP]